MMMKLSWTRRRLAGFALAVLPALVAVTPLLMAASPAQAQDPGPDSALDAARRPAPVGYPVLPGIWRLHGSDPDLPNEDLEPLRRIIGRATVVGLGESFHYSGGFYEMKHRLFRYLVEEMGFRAFAIESDWTGAELTAQYVQSCAGTAEESLRRHIIVWQSHELADLARWMCEWNREHPRPADKVHYFGFDIQQPEDDGPALVAFLRRIGFAEDHPWIAGIRVCEGVRISHPFGEIPQELHDQCMAALNAIETHIQSNQRTLQRQMSRQDFEMGKLRLVSLKSWQLTIFIIPDDFAAGYSARDEGMAYVFRTLRALRFPKARTVAWAANSHVSRTELIDGATLPFGSAWPFGGHLAAALGRNYVSFALTSNEAITDSTDLCYHFPTVEGSVEDRLSELGGEALLVDLTFPGARDPFLPPGRYTMGEEVFDLRRHFNGVIYLNRSPAMNPLYGPPCR
jgi:erythromycin esterase-like protein